MNIMKCMKRFQGWAGIFVLYGQKALQNKSGRAQRPENASFSFITFTNRRSEVRHPVLSSIFMNIMKVCEVGIFIGDFMPCIKVRAGL
jgi:hypothetical protein